MTEERPEVATNAPGEQLLWHVVCEDCSWSSERTPDQDAATSALARHIRRRHRRYGANVRVELLRPRPPAADDEESPHEFGGGDVMFAHDLEEDLEASRDVR